MAMHDIEKLGFEILIEHVMRAGRVVEGILCHEYVFPCFVELSHLETCWDECDREGAFDQFFFSCNTDQDI
jgi:hypothetical protein